MLWSMCLKIVSSPTGWTNFLCWWRHNSFWWNWWRWLLLCKYKPIYHLWSFGLFYIVHSAYVVEIFWHSFVWPCVDTDMISIPEHAYQLILSSIPKYEKNKVLFLCTCCMLVTLHRYIITFIALWPGSQ